MGAPTQTDGSLGVVVYSVELCRFSCAALGNHNAMVAGRLLLPRSGMTTADLKELFAWDPEDGSEPL